MICLIPIFYECHKATTPYYFFEQNELFPYRHVKSIGNFFCFFYK